MKMRKGVVVDRLRRIAVLVALEAMAGSFAGVTVAEENPFCAADYAALRRELRAFYPDECHGVCKDPRQTNSVVAIGRELDAWAAAPSSPAVRGRARCWDFGRRVIDRSGSTMLTESYVNSM